MSIPWRHVFDREVPDSHTLCEHMQKNPCDCRGAFSYVLQEYAALRESYLAALRHIDYLEATRVPDDFPSRFPYQDAPGRALKGVSP